MKITSEVITQEANMNDRRKHDAADKNEEKKTKKYFCMHQSPSIPQTPFCLTHPAWQDNKRPILTTMSGDVPTTLHHWMEPLLEYALSVTLETHQ